MNTEWKQNEYKMLKEWIQMECRKKTEWKQYEYKTKAKWIQKKTEWIHNEYIMNT